MKEEKFDMFKDMDRTFAEIEEGESTEVESVTLKANSTKKYNAFKPSRSVEDYQAMIDSTYVEVHYTKENVPYNVTVTVLKPEINPLEFMRPVFVYSTNH